MIRKLKNGKYRVDIVNEHGRRERLVFNKKTEADAYETKVKDRKNDLRLIGLKLKKGRYPVDKALDDFMGTKTDLRAKSLQKYSAVLRYIKAFFRSNNIIYIDQFTTDSATDYYNQLNQDSIIEDKFGSKVNRKAQPRTRNFYLRVLKSFFQYEFVKGHIDKNPTIHLSNFKVEKKKPEYFSAEELGLLLSQDMNSVYRNAFLGLIYTGMRFSELSNLTWDDVDLSNKHIIIKAKENYLTKTPESERRIPIGNKLNQLLCSMHKNKLSGKYPFCNLNGEKLSENTLLAVCKKKATDAGIKGRAFLHKFRHSYASLLIQNGSSIESIQRLLGHNSIVTTQMYAHHVPDYLHKEVEILDKLISDKKVSSPSTIRDYEVIPGRGKNANK